MKTNFSLLFYMKKQKNYQSGPAPIYMRITVNGKRAEMTTGRECEPQRWNAGSGRVSGTKEDAKTLNAYLEGLRAKVFDAHSELTRDGDLVTSETLKNKFLGCTEKPRMLLGIIKDHNQRMEALIGDEYAVGTHRRFKVLYSHTVSFLKSRYHLSDYDIKKIDFAFIADYEFHLRSVRKMGNNAAVKHMKMLRKIINICLNNRWLLSDPFANYKGRYKTVNRDILTEQEIMALTEKEFVSERLGQVRDTFLFCCYTGLAYTDIQKLKASQIARGIDGHQWVFTQRTKTDVRANIPLLPQAVEIAGKYADHPVCVSKQTVLPVPSNQKMNEYLKEIATLCGITKPMTTHIARHTFATTVALQNGVPIETVSKMLGHTNIRTTQIYAKILDTKVSEDMLGLKDRMEKRAQQAVA